MSGVSSTVVGPFATRELLETVVCCISSKTRASKQKEVFKECRKLAHELFGGFTLAPRETQLKSGAIELHVRRLLKPSPLQAGFLLKGAL